MKYIRTPIGIYDLENSIFYDFDGLCKYHISHCEYYENNPDECKSSDLLEELCDGFYIDVDLNVERNFEYAFHHFEHFAKTMKSFRTTSKVMVKRLGGGYGYIRTDKCLLYVGKLNDKGELVLI